MIAEETGDGASAVTGVPRASGVAVEDIVRAQAGITLRIEHAESLLAQLLPAPLTAESGAGIVPDRWRERSGIYHLTAQGRTTWYEFAKAIIEHPSTPRKPVVMPIATADYPLPAKRPANSVLSCERLKSTFCGLPDWDVALGLCRE